MFTRCIRMTTSKTNDYGKKSRERLISIIRRGLVIMPTIPEIIESSSTTTTPAPMSYSEAYGIKFTIPTRQFNSNAESDDAELILHTEAVEAAEAYQNLYSSTKTRKAFNGRQKKRSAGNLEIAKIFAQEFKKTAKIISTSKGLTSLSTNDDNNVLARSPSSAAAAAAALSENNNTKPTKADLRLKTNKLAAKRAYKIQQACACICDRAILKSVGCNCV